MNNTERGVTVTATAFLTAAVLLVGPGRGWPWWVWVPAALAPSAVAMLVYRALARERDAGHVLRRAPHDRTPPPPTTAPATPDAAPPQRPHTRREPVSDVSLACAVEDYRFLFSATVCWLPDPAPDRRTELHANPGALAREAVVSRARRLLAGGAPEEHDLLTERLNAALGAIMSVPAGHLHVWAENVSVRLSEEDSERLRRLAAIRKDERLWEHERRYERGLRAYLAEDVLRDPGRAVVWFLARTTDRRPVDLDEVIGNLDNLRLLTSAAHATNVPPWEPSGDDGDACVTDSGDTPEGLSDDDPALYPSPAFDPPATVAPPVPTPPPPGDDAPDGDGHRTGAP